MFHSAMPLGEIHRITQWVVADAAARTALAGSLVAADIGKVLLQLDTAVPYMLTNNVGPVWTAMSAAGGMLNPMTTLNDIIVGGVVAGGVAAPARLAMGALRQNLRVNFAANALEYADDSAVSVIAAPAAGVITLNCSLGDYFTHTTSANITGWTISNLLGANRGNTKMIRITQGATPRTVAWPSSFRWEGAAPTVTASAGAVDVLALTSFDNGTKWDATLSKGRV